MWDSEDQPEDINVPDRWDDEPSEELHFERTPPGPPVRTAQQVRDWVATLPQLAQHMLCDVTEEGYAAVAEHHSSLWPEILTFYVAPRNHSLFRQMVVQTQVETSEAALIKDLFQ